MDPYEYNQDAWNRQVRQGQRWTVPVTPEKIEAARAGEWSIVLTNEKAVPRHWFPDPLEGVPILGLASGGGQQMPILAAAGARVSLLDASEGQLEQDRRVAEREGLEIRTVLGDMADLSAFDDESFDLIFHPCSNSFAKDIRPVWREAFRVLRPGGALLSGFSNPISSIFCPRQQDQGKLEVRYSVPFSEFRDLPEEDRAHYVGEGEPLLFGHTLEDQIGGQLDAGFRLEQMYEDRDSKSALGRFIATQMATRAVKP